MRCAAPIAVGPQAGDPGEGAHLLETAGSALDDDGWGRQYQWLPPVRAEHAFSVRASMIGSLDGRATLRGRSGSLGNPTDQRLLELLRDLSDAVLVGAGTIRAEGYGKFQLSDRRRRWGRGEPPRLVVVTRGGPGRLPADLPIFTGPGPVPVLLTSETGGGSLAGLPAEVVVAGKESVDLTAGLAALATSGLRRLQTEGGPELLGGLLAAGLLDELCLTIAPYLVGPDEPGLTGSRSLDPTRWTLLRIARSGDHLLARYRLAG